jgi:putative transposase
VLNRAVARLAIFETDGDYAAFIQVLREVSSRQDALAASGKAARVEILAWCLMPNHWHLVLRPLGDGDLSAFVRWLTMIHTQRWHAHRRSAGTGPLYQGRFKSFPVDDEDRHLEDVVAYVEQNPRRAGLVDEAMDWPWSSLQDRSLQRTRTAAGPPLLPVERWPGNHAWTGMDWLSRVEEESDVEAEQDIDLSLRRSRPLGRGDWCSRVAGRLHLQSTLRSPGRPRKEPAS